MEEFPEKENLEEKSPSEKPADRKSEKAELQKEYLAALDALEKDEEGGYSMLRDKLYEAVQGYDYRSLIKFRDDNYGSLKPIERRVLDLKIALTEF